MDKGEMRQITESIARDSENGAARIAALRFLRDLDRDSPDPNQPRSAFAELDELAPRRKVSLTSARWRSGAGRRASTQPLGAR